MYITIMKSSYSTSIGALATAACLTYGLNSLRTGDRKMSQIMMRARVVAQGFTLAALVGGIMLAAKKNDPTPQE